MKKTHLVQNYFILPICLLLLNLLNTIISYKAEMIDDQLLRVFIIMLLVLFGSSVVAFLIAPGLASAVQSLHRSSKQGAGSLGEILFMAVLAVVVFWLYYQVYIHGPASILPADWANPRSGK
jgi:hypothetical protein